MEAETSERLTGETDGEAQPARGDSDPYLSTISRLRQVLARSDKRRLKIEQNHPLSTCRTRVRHSETPPVLQLRFVINRVPIADNQVHLVETDT